MTGIVVLCPTPSIKLIDILCREQAQTYVYDPARVDSRRGLKRTWSRKEDEPIPSSSKEKPSSEEKGTYQSI